MQVNEYPFKYINFYLIVVQLFNFLLYLLELSNLYQLHEYTLKYPTDASVTLNYRNVLTYLISSLWCPKQILKIERFGNYATLINKVTRNYPAKFTVKHPRRCLL